MGQKTISDLNSLTKTSLSGSDLALITDVSAKETKNIEISELVSYINSKLDFLLTGSFTGSFYGNLKGNSNTSSLSQISNLSLTSSKLLFDGNVNGTASLSIITNDSSYSLSSSYSVSSSYSISSSRSNVSSYTLNSSSNHSLSSNFASRSLHSDESLTSSYLNYYGQNNGTVLSSSFAERSIYSLKTDNLLTEFALSSSIQTALSKNSKYSFYTKECSTAITSSTSNYSDVAEETVPRLFSSVEFSVEVDDNNNINITPISWKNIKNISAGKVGNYYLDFYVKYKNKPLIDLQDEKFAESMNLATIGSVQLQNDNLTTNSVNVPVWNTTVFPCGKEGYVIRFTHYTCYKEEKKAGWAQLVVAIATGLIGGIFAFAALPAFLATIAAVLNVAGYILLAAGGGALIAYFFGNDDGAVSNTGPLYWKKYLNGTYISAQTICNVNNFIDVGPQSTLSQFVKKLNNLASLGVTSLKFFKSVSDFPINKSKINISQNSTAPGIYNKVVSIAHQKNSDKNLILMAESNDSNDRQILTSTGSNLTVTSIHYPRTGSESSDIIQDLKQVRYNEVSGDYYGISANKLIYTSSTYINNYTGSDYQGSIFNPTSPIFKSYTNASLTNLVSAVGLTDKKYILVRGDSYTLSNPTLPIYVASDVTTTSAPNQSTAGTIPVTQNVKLGSTVTDPTKLPSGVSLDEITRTISINSTVFTDVAKIDSTKAIVVGDNGVVLYTNDSGQKWQRIDYIVRTDNFNLKSSILYPTKINSVNVLDIVNANNTVDKFIIMTGHSDYKNTRQSFILGCTVPPSGQDLNPNMWNWNPIKFETILPRNNKTNQLITNKQSSFNNIFAENSSSIVVGYNSFDSGSYYNYSIGTYTPYTSGDIDSTINVKCSSKISDDQYLFGGDGFLNIYQLTRDN